MPKHHIDLVKLTNDQLRNLNRNAINRGGTELSISVCRELHRRGALMRTEYGSLRWNEATVAKVLEPFAMISGSVLNSRRTPYTSGGGLRRRPKADPERMMVDSYSAIKRGPINAAFAGRIKQPGDEPEFELSLNGEKHIFALSELEVALLEWRRIADAA